MKKSNRWDKKCENGAHWLLKQRLIFAILFGSRDRRVVASDGPKFFISYRTT